MSSKGARARENHPPQKKKKNPTLLPLPLFSIDTIGVVLRPWGEGPLYRGSGK